MRANGFLLFDLNLNRITRKNIIGSFFLGKPQILWCDSIWLKDYIKLEGNNDSKLLTREKALKSLIICSLAECYDFGYELAELYHKKKLISQKELIMLQDINNWYIVKSDINIHDQGSVKSDINIHRFFLNFIDLTLRLLPHEYRRAVADRAEKAIGRPNLIREMVKDINKLAQRRQPAE